MGGIRVAEIPRGVRFVEPGQFTYIHR